MAKKAEIPEEIRQFALIARVMGHPVRLYILHKLAGMNSCCYSGDLVEEIPVGRSTLSQHLKELKNAGLIQGEVEPPYIKYCLNRENWEKAREMFNRLLVKDKNQEYDECKKEFQGNRENH
jgi:DNA-binding transcriptional ArsR family regulator